MCARGGGVLTHNGDTTIESFAHNTGGGAGLGWGGTGDGSGLGMGQDWDGLGLGMGQDWGGAGLGWGRTGHGAKQNTAST